MNHCHRYLPYGSCRLGGWRASRAVRWGSAWVHSSWREGLRLAVVTLDVNVRLGASSSDGCELKEIISVKMSIRCSIKDSPTRRNEDDNGNNDCATYGSTRGYCYLIHVRCLRRCRANLSTLWVRNVLRCHSDVLERYHTNNNALGVRHVLDLKFTLRWLEWRALLEGLIAEETINNSKAENVGGVRVPLNNDRIIRSAVREERKITNLFSSFTFAYGKAYMRCDKLRIWWSKREEKMAKIF